MNVKERRNRSDPSISLKEAVAKVKLLYDKEHRNETSVLLALKSFGYNSLSGASRVLLADLKKYGLIDYKGSGDNKQIAVSELAEEILHPGSTAKAKSTQGAVLKIPTFAELWNSRPGATHETLSFYLTSKRHYTTKVAEDLVRIYRESIDYAGFSSDTSHVKQAPVEPVSTGEQGGKVASVQTAEAIAIQEIITIDVAVDAKQKLSVLFPRSMTKERWEKVRPLVEGQIQLILEEGEKNQEKPV